MAGNARRAAPKRALRVLFHVKDGWSDNHTFDYSVDCAAIPAVGEYFMLAVGDGALWYRALLVLHIAVAEQDWVAEVWGVCERKPDDLVRAVFRRVGARRRAAD